MADTYDRTRVRHLAEWFLSDSDIANQDLFTFDTHSDALAKRIQETIEDYIEYAERAAEPMTYEQWRGSPAYYRQSEDL
jgi:hypothetical protein